ncbi:osteoclast-associated immunoglobulin-like receptor [Pleurodeles waltl]|uniref:osteoclast-associated immunoglobulin-like receptor n=1 Tax=Pleurodeles waltl TaxID=8319 RepID=UPI0037096F09
MKRICAPFLSLAYCILAGQNMAQGRGHPFTAPELGLKPDFSVIPERNVIIGENLTFICQGPRGGLNFTLIKDGNVTQELHSSGKQAEFHILGVQEGAEGEYSCCYRLASNSSALSESSIILDVTVGEYYTPPSLVVRPQSMSLRGTDVVIVCRCQRQNMRFVLYKDSEISQEKDADGQEAKFYITGASAKDVGQYICCYRSRSDHPKAYSHLSDPVIINVTDLPKPWINWEHDPGTEGEYIILCKAPAKYGGSWFRLYNDAVLIREEKAEGHVTQVSFSVNHTSGVYRCLYRVPVSGDLANSPVSKSLAIGVDFSRGNNFRFVLAGLVLTLIVLIISEDWFSRKRERRQAQAGSPVSMLKDKDTQQTLSVQDSL